MTPRSPNTSFEDPMTSTPPQDQSSRLGHMPTSSLAHRSPTSPLPTVPTPPTTSPECNDNITGRSMNPCALPFTPSPDLGDVRTTSPANASHRDWLFRPPPTARLGDDNGYHGQGNTGKQLASMGSDDGGNEVGSGLNLLPRTNNLTSLQTPVPAVNHGPLAHHTPDQNIPPWDHPVFQLVVDDTGTAPLED